MDLFKFLDKYKEMPRGYKMFFSCLTQLSKKFPLITAGPGSEVIKLFSCSTQLSITFSLLMNMKMPTKIGIFIFISREIFTLSYI